MGAELLAQTPKPVKKQPPVFQNEQGKLLYTPDSLGNRVPDFSYCGYRAGAESIPDVPIRVVVNAQKGDATNRIQAAIDYVATLPLDKNGFRGTVLLGKGTFEVAGQLSLKTSGVVLRGSGMIENGTTVIGTGTSREHLVNVIGKQNGLEKSRLRITNPYVPVNAMTLSVEDASGLKVGDAVQVHRPSTKEWIQALGTEHFGGGVTALGWKAGQRDSYWDRTITAISGNELTLDAPLTIALDAAYGGGSVRVYQQQNTITNVGVENLRLVSAYDATNPKDEDHRWVGISLDNVQDAWVRQVTFKHFAGSAVSVLASARRVTVEDCRALEPVSEIGGERRYTFFTQGQQGLFQRLYAENGYHDFAVGYCAAGPNAFVQCESHEPYSFSGTIDSWASGVLFDIVNIDGNALSFGNLGQDGQGAGWTAANSVFWQCTAAKVDCPKPPTAQNWAFGTWAQFAGNGHWEMSNEHIRPRSLYYAQLADRLGESTKARMILMPVESEASSSPKVEVAMALTKLAQQPVLTLNEFIQKAPERQSITIQTTAKTIEQLGLPTPSKPTNAPALTLQNGWLMRGNVVQTGKRQEVPWWNGSARPHGLENAKPHLTRFVPRMTGRGLTDDLNEVSEWMKANNVLAIDHNYGLWYDRRRDDHERIRRMDSEVWTPFYELPFARSGKETAWDGLSKYDLTRYNRWYWSRLQQFAQLADQKGLVLIHQNYFQHNIIEAGAHYADFPWRPANNLNQTGFPEPVPYAGDKRIFMAEQFYDVSQPVRRQLHRAYIRQCLDNFSEQTGVIQLISAEYTGPLSFVQFWLDVIKEWEKEKKKNVWVALSTTKDVQDAILADASRAATVDVIDIRYWHYQANGTTYAPAGGQNLAPRQHARLLNPKRSSFDQVYRAVSEYRQQFPEKAVMYSGDGYDAFGWAILLAGGSMASIPTVADRQFLKDLSTMKPLASSPPQQWVSGNANVGFVIYTESAEASLDLTQVPHSYTLRFISPKTGEMTTSGEEVKGGTVVTVKNPTGIASVIWLKKR
ncbi:pectate lyase [Runella sp. SP2]|nr:pectate lyase [Runella sp. SP2]